MFRPASRTLLQRSLAPHIVRRSAQPARRFLSTAPPAQKARSSWKGTALRWGLAAGAVYYYNTSSVFADEPYAVHKAPEIEEETVELPDLETISAQRRQKQIQDSKAAQATGSESVKVGSIGGDEDEGTEGGPRTPEEYEEEAGQQGAFNEETGEINWDCPCLGGMAHGPCGDEFKEAFSCFVFSKEEPKGMDCIDKFKGMQDCFRLHPDVYGSELEDDEEYEDDADQVESPELGAATSSPSSSSPPSSPSTASTPPPTHGEKVTHVRSNHTPAPAEEVSAKRDRANAASRQVKEEHAPLDESDELVPKAAHDSRSMNDGK
ncbi:MAG: hypothetical protein M1819_000505 [Sarea resinae]|nr:MAG: hypothetical protein M1819_000505 [Sarea resinae]